MTLDGNDYFRIVGRTVYMDTDYYLGYHTDNNGQAMYAKDIVFEDIGGQFEPDFDENAEACEICFVESRDLAELLWMIFEEQERLMRGGW